MKKARICGVKKIEAIIFEKKVWWGKYPNELKAYLDIWPQGYKTFFMLNSTEHEIYPAHKC